MACSPQTIDDLLADPMIQAVMRADRVETVQLKQMLTGVAERRRERDLDLKGAKVWFCGQPRPKAALKLWPLARGLNDHAKL